MLQFSEISEILQNPNFTFSTGISVGMTTDLMVPSKRPRAPSFTEKHPHEYSTAGVSDWSQEKQVHFLELCGFCKKKLSQNKDVFMYGYLGAFCSKKCREKQMAFDIFNELHSQGKSNPKKGRICLTNKPKDEASTSFERIITPSPSSSSSTSPRFFI